MSKQLKFIDLFCGMGGFRLALESQGFACVFSSDIHPHARNLYQLNFSDMPDGDITKINVKDIPLFDILTGGFPCQSFSRAGKQLGFEDSRGTLFFEIARIVKHHQPKVLILENVKNLLIHDKGETFKVIQSVLNDLGYHVDYKILNAVDFGIPQNRERLVIVANNMGKLFDFSLVNNLTHQSMRDLLPDRGSSYLHPEEYTLLPTQDLKIQASGLIFCGYRNKNLRISGVKENSSHLSRAHKQPNRIYHINGVHPTLSSQEPSGRYFIQDDYGVRKLSVAECMLLMGYDENYHMTGNTSEMYARIGNSVCVPLFKEVAKEVLNQLF